MSMGYLAPVARRFAHIILSQRWSRFCVVAIHFWILHVQAAFSQLREGGLSSVHEEPIAKYLSCNDKKRWVLL